jgi:OmpA-OmpF porin, OOP family
MRTVVRQPFRAGLAGAVLGVLLLPAASAQPAGEVKALARPGVVFVSNVDREVALDLGSGVASTDQVRAGLFPEDLESPEQKRDRENCEQLLQAGYKCMPPARSYLRFGLPGLNFRIGSAELPDLMKQQLRSFAEVLRGRSAAAPVIRIDGHADATGQAQANLLLSRQRAEAVRDFLVSQGASPALFSVEGLGSSDPRNKSDPAAPENRRVEIARNLPR